MKRKTLKSLLISLFAIILLVLFLIPEIIQTLVEKKSDEIIGRQITFSDVHINYFKAKIKLSDLLVYEENTIDTFLFVSEITVNFDPLYMFKKQYVFSQISIKNPFVRIVHTNDQFNFSDLIPVADSNNNAPSDSSKQVLLAVNDFSLIHGSIEYCDKELNSLLKLNNINISVPDFSLSNENTLAGINFVIGERGLLHIDANLSNETDEYQLNLKTQNIDIQQFKAYVDPYIDAHTFAGLVHSDVRVNGSLVNYDNVMISGKVMCDSLLLTDSENQLVTSVQRIETTFDSINISNSTAYIQSAIITKPIINIVVDTNATNIEKVLYSVNSSDTVDIETQGEIVDTVQSEDYHFTLDNFAIHNGRVLLHDNTLNRSFNYVLDSINIGASNISDTSKQVPFNLQIKTPNSGNVRGEFVFDMKNFEYLDAVLHVENIHLMSFSPYTEYYLASPITRGYFTLNSSVQLNDNNLINNNIISIDNLEFGKNTDDTTATKLPIKLALYVLKDRNGFININMPVQGKTSDPDFSYKTILFKTLSNFVLKTASAPIQVIGNMFGINPEKIQQIEFSYADSSLAGQNAKIEKICEIMRNKPNLHFRFIQFTHTNDEKQYLAKTRAYTEFERYIATIDSLKIQPVSDSIFNTWFVDYLRTKQNLNDTLSVSAMIDEIYNTPDVENRFNEIIDLRNRSMHQLLQKGGVSSEMYTVETAHLENIPHELRFPHFKVEVSVK